MASNKDRNKIQSLTSLTSLTGGRLEDPASIKDEILQYYVGLLGTTFEVSNDARRDLGITSIMKVPEELLSQSVLSLWRRSKSSLASIKRDKSPGPDGV